MTRDTTARSALYRGELVHARHDHLARRAFTYPVYVASLDLDELPALDRSLRLFSHRGRNLFSFDERDYASTLSPSIRVNDDRVRATASADTGAGSNELLTGLAALRAANDLPVPHTTRLVTNLRVAGYVFNPVSFFIDYDARGDITSAIAEVNNTYGGSFRYVLGPTARLPGERVGFRHVRELFVSPFLHGPATYDFYFDAPLDAEHVAVEMHVTRGQAPRSSAIADTAIADTAIADTAIADTAIADTAIADTAIADTAIADTAIADTAIADTAIADTAIADTAGKGTDRSGRLFTAKLAGTRTPLTDRVLALTALRYPFMTAQVIGLIHYEALKLRLRGVPYRRPDRDHRPLAVAPR